MTPRASLLFFVLATTFCAAQTYTVTDLGALPGGHSSGAKAINAKGQVTGFAFDANATISDIFRYSLGSMTDLGTLRGSSAIGDGINASGQIAGYSTNSSLTYRAFLSNGNNAYRVGSRRWYLLRRQRQLLRLHLGQW